MIAPVDGLPLLRLESGQVTCFREEWLASSLHHAALDAGVSPWWPAADVARSITAYLREGYDDRTITLPSVVEAVRKTLSALGFGEIGDRFTPDPFIVQISLPALALAAPPGCDLFFFSALTSRLEEHGHTPRQKFDFIGLRPAVKILLSRRVWSKKCSILEREIVGHIRGSFFRDQMADNLRANIS